MEDKNLAICYCGDANAVKGIIVSAYSALHNLRRVKAKVYIIDCGFKENQITEIREHLEQKEELSELRVIKPQSFPFDQIKNSTFPRAATARIQIADLVDEEVVLYLDYDTLVTKDLSTLWLPSLENTLFCAVQDSWEPRLPSNNEPWSNAPQFNSGVMLMNLDLWRKESISRQLENWLSDVGAEYSYPYADQSFLNFTLYNRWKPLDPTWNWMMGLKPKEADFGPFCPSILHFSRKWKPWHFSSVGALGVVKEYYKYVNDLGIDIEMQPGFRQPRERFTTYLRQRLRVKRYIANKVKNPLNYTESN
jgi:lipopolysaccharide biosynthesis glycosyltransferase